jgi:hypothetical protein
MLTTGVLMVATVAGAQDRVGVTMGYPASVGLLLRVTDGVAIRPEVSFGQSSGSSTDQAASLIFGTQSSVDTTSVSVGASALFYVGKWDSLRTYVAPRFQYSRNSTSVANAVANPLTSASDDVTASNYGFAGLFGAEYGLGTRFAVFGEVGYGYTRTHQSALSLESTVNATGTRTGVGVVFFF